MHKPQPQLRKQQQGLEKWDLKQQFLIQKVKELELALLENKMKFNGKKVKRFILKTKPKIKPAIKKAIKKAKPKFKKFKKRAKVISSNIDYYFGESERQLRSFTPQNDKIRF